VNKILVVDDEPNIIEILEIVLRDEGMEVLKASSGCEALALLRENSVDIVISDIRMPDVLASRFSKKLKRSRPTRSL
jgi:CheY-like chemotaxis protein